MTGNQAVHRRNWWLAIMALTGLALVFRLLVWRWRELYPLGGDEAEYLAQAITLLQERRYVELRLMRPPLYPLFLATAILFVDSLVQNLRLAQSIISTLTVPLIVLLTHTLARRSVPQAPPAFARWAGLLAGLLTALNYTLAANATELLTETLFLAGLSLLFWLILLPKQTARLATSAGVVTGALCLVRSVALPLLPLTIGWWLINGWQGGQRRQKFIRIGMFLLGWALVVGPWTIRNTLTYGGVIVIDTTGAENLWLDNDPAGREAVKAQLYALGEDRLYRQRLATERGVAVILADPVRFIMKMGQELRRFFALEHTDDMRARPAIWVSAAEVAARLVLGDGLWLLILLVGSYGLMQRWQTVQPDPSPRSSIFFRTLTQPGWLLSAWAAYVLFTTLIFHVELRYRLPLYPVLLAYTGMTGAAWQTRLLPLLPRQRWTLLVPSFMVLITLWHAPYPIIAWQLANKHWNLLLAEHALANGDAMTAVDAASKALAHDEQSVLARVALARAALLGGDETTALHWLDEAISILPAHPYPHLLRGDVLRRQGDLIAAQRELNGFATASREDLAAWLWARAVTPPPTRLLLGDGLDLGFIRGMHQPLPGEHHWRWTTRWAQMRLTAPAGARQVALTLQSGRPDNSAVTIWITVAGSKPQPFMIGAERQTITLPLPTTTSSREVIISIRSPTFWPRQYDPASADGRRLGVQLVFAEVR